VLNSSDANFQPLGRGFLFITLTAAPAVSTPGAVPGVQFPATIKAASGIAIRTGAPWDLAESPDLILGTSANQ
jgi:hypothetical protein